jgi:hypothetical protein
MEEVSNGVENCIFVAFGACNKKSSLVEINERLDDNSVAATISVPITSRINLCGLKCLETKPSDILKDSAKVGGLFSTFNAKGKLSYSKLHDAKADSNKIADSHAFFTLPNPCETEGEGMSAVKQVLALGQQESCIGCLLDDSYMPFEGRHIMS